MADVNCNNHIAEHHLKTKHEIDWDSATCITYSTDYYQRLTLESWFTNLEQTPLNRSQQLPAPYKRLIRDFKQITTSTSTTAAGSKEAQKRRSAHASK